MILVTARSYRKKRVLGGKKGKRRIGKVAYAVFHPEEPRIVGFIVRRPDLLLMIKRKDRFITFDGFDIVDGRLVAHADGEVWDEAGCKRLGIDLDDCIIWENMDLKTEDGHELGRIGDIIVSEETGEVSSIVAGDGALAKKLLGNMEIPLELIKGYNKGYIVLKPEAADVGLSGGWAAKAGAATAKARHKGSEAARKTGETVNEGAYKLGQGIGYARDKVEEKKAEHDALDQDQLASYKLGEALGKARDRMREYTSDDMVDSPSEKAGASPSVASTDEDDARGVVADPKGGKTPGRPAGKPAAKRDRSSGDDEDGAGSGKASLTGMFTAFKEEYSKARHEDDE